MYVEEVGQGEVEGWTVARMYWKQKAKIILVIKIEDVTYLWDLKGKSWVWGQLGFHSKKQIVGEMSIANHFWIVLWEEGGRRVQTRSLSNRPGMIFKMEGLGWRATGCVWLWEWQEKGSVGKLSEDSQDCQYFSHLIETQVCLPPPDL